MTPASQRLATPIRTSSQSSVSNKNQMPRLSTSLLLRAYQENPLLHLLLKECRTLGSARNELRWLRERALRDTCQATRTPTGWRTRLRAMCLKRSQGVPLQYILGDQPFGDLEILCRRGVLIPRYGPIEQQQYLPTYTAQVHLPGLTQSHIHTKQPGSSGK